MVVSDYPIWIECVVLCRLISVGTLVLDAESEFLIGP